MVEISRKFPSPEMLDRLAQALGIQTYQLFDPTITPDGALTHLEQAIVENIGAVVKNKVKQEILGEIKQVIRTEIIQAFLEERKGKKK
jgi:transcriptional regulator with XRE-family HTH domain